MTQVIRKAGARLAELAADNAQWTHGIDPPTDIERVCVREMFADQLQAAVKAPAPPKPRKGGKGGKGGKGSAHKDTPGEGEEGAAEQERAVQEEQAMAQLTRVLRAARAAYTMRAQLQEVDGGVDGPWGALAEQFRGLRVGKEVLQLAVHREVWCRVAIESLPPEHRCLGAHQRCARLRWCLAVLLHGRGHCEAGREQAGREDEEDALARGNGCNGDDEGNEMVLNGRVARGDSGEDMADRESTERVLTEFVQWGGDFRRRRIAWGELPHLPPLPPLHSGLPALQTSVSALAQFRQMGQDWRRQAFLHIIISRHSLGDAGADEACGHGLPACAAAGGSHDGVIMEVERGRSQSAAADGEVAGAVSAEELARVREKMAQLPADVVVLCCALWLVVHSCAGSGLGEEQDKAARISSLSHHQFSALVASVTFPREAFPAWLDALLSREAEAEATERKGADRLVAHNLNACTCLNVVLSWANALNDALAVPFPRQDVAVISPRLLLVL